MTIWHGPEPLPSTNSGNLKREPEDDNAMNAVTTGYTTDQSSTDHRHPSQPKRIKHRRTKREALHEETWNQSSTRLRLPPSPSSPTPNFGFTNYSPCEDSSRGRSAQCSGTFSAISHSRRLRLRVGICVWACGGGWIQRVNSSLSWFVK